MDARSTRALAVTALAVAAALSLCGLGVSLWANAVDDASMLASALSAAVVLSFVVVGGIVAMARPDNRIGWVMLAGGTCWAVGNAGIDLAYRGIVAAPGSVPAASSCALLGGAFRTTGWYLLAAALPGLFPDGRLAGRRWRWLGYTVVIAIVTSIAGSLLDKQANITDLGAWRNPLAVAWLRPVAGTLSMVSLLAGAAATIGAIFELRYRWRHGDALLRQQLLLFASVLPLPFAAIVLNVIVDQTVGWLFSATMLPIPISIGVAVMARGLYDLRTAANRTLVWVLLWVAVLALYVLVIFGIGSFVDQVGADWLPWVAAAIVAISFAPLRGLVQQAINRITFGRWQEPYTVLAELGQRLEATGDVDRLLEDVVSELEDGFGLRGVSISDAHGQLLAGTPSPGSARHPLSAFGTVVGSLTYSAPASSLRARDERLLTDLSGHLGGLLHARLLTADLQSARERLVLAREEERRRLRRDLHDGLGPALAAHVLRLDLIGREVPVGSQADRDIGALRREMMATVADFRKVVEGLRPPALDELGLAGALRQVGSRLALGSGAILDVKVAELPVVPAAVEVAAFRIVTEAVSNAVRHAHASMITVQIDAAVGALRIEIRDDGIGRGAGDVGRGNGLETMRERAMELSGRLTVSYEDGTCVLAEIPLPRIDPARSVAGPTAPAAEASVQVERGAPAPHRVSTP